MNPPSARAPEFRMNFLLLCMIVNLIEQLI
jgi:hypothetical protein